MRFNPIASCGDLMRGIGLAVLALVLTVTVANAERRIALVLGNSHYQNAPVLPNPVNDAQAMSDRLKKPEL